MGINYPGSVFQRWSEQPAAGVPLLGGVLMLRNLLAAAVVVGLAGLAGAQLKIAGAQFLEAFPHTEGLRLITSSAAIFDQDFHGVKVGA